MNPSDGIERRQLHTLRTSTQWAILSICFYSGGGVKSRDLRRAPRSVFGERKQAQPDIDIRYVVRGYELESRASDFVLPYPSYRGGKPASKVNTTPPGK